MRIHKRLLTWLALIPGALCAAPSVMDALHDIKPVPQVCPRPDAPAAALPARISPAVEVTPATEAACARDAAQVAELAKLPGTVIVDTRLAGDFQRFHINGALNLAADAVRTRPFLARHTLVLVDSGKGERESYRQCSQLRSSGYGSTYVLQGGMPAWVAEQLPVLGTAPALIDQIRLSPADLFVEASAGSNRVIVTPGVANISKDIPAATLVDITAGGGGIKHLGTHPGMTSGSHPAGGQSGRAGAPSTGAGGSVVLVTDPGFGPADVERVAAAVRPRPVLVYLEGAKAYSAFLTSQKAVWAAHARGPKVPPCSLR